MKALYNDFKKPAEEAKPEISIVTDEIDFVVAFLESWMKPQIMTTPDALGGPPRFQKLFLNPRACAYFLRHGITLSYLLFAR